MKVFNRFLTLVLISVSSSLNAASTIQQEKQQVLAVAKKYAESTACATTFDKDTPAQERTNLQDVFLDSRDTELGEATYYVLWGGDIGCLGGSGTFYMMLSVVSRWSDYRPFLVTTASIFDQEDLGGTEAGQINSRFIESVAMVQPNVIEVVSWNFADTKYGGKDEDGTIPANKFRYIMRFDTQNGKWKVVQQTLLEQNK